MKLLVIASSDFVPLSRLATVGGVTVTAGTEAAGLEEAIVDADAILIAPRYGAILRDLLPRARHLRWIHALGAGIETLPFDLFRQSDVVVTNSAGVYADALSEFAIAAMLYFAKDLRQLVENQCAKRWAPFTVERLEGKSVGIIGYGGIGRAIGRRAAAMGMNVLATRRGGPIDDGIVSESFAVDRLDELLGRSDYVAISAPLTSSTRGLINERRLSLMKREAVLVNVSRGAIVDEHALIRVLRRKEIRGAALDVFQFEPLRSSSPLWNLDNVLLSPHSADRTSDSHDRAMTFYLENLTRFRSGEPLRNIVDKEAEY